MPNINATFCNNYGESRLRIIMDYASTLIRRPKSSDAILTQPRALTRCLSVVMTELTSKYHIRWSGAVGR
jgi:hypothetical protein